MIRWAINDEKILQLFFFDHWNDSELGRNVLIWKDVFVVSIIKSATPSNFPSDVPSSTKKNVAEIAQVVSEGKAHEGISHLKQK